MKKFFIFSLLFSLSAWGYVPPVESLFRHGPNPDVTANGVLLTFKVKKSGTQKNSDSSLFQEHKAEDYYRLFYTKVNAEVMKIAQARYSNSSFSENALTERKYFSNFNLHTFKGVSEDAEKGLFQAVLRSILFNDGSYLVGYLKTMGAPIKHNNEIINRQKVEYLANYKQYLVAINKDKNNKRTEINPLKPEDPVAREKVEAVMNSSMYIDQEQVKLSRENGRLAWLVSAAPLEAVVSYDKREIEKVKIKTQMGEVEFICKDYWLANGSHAVPKIISIKDFSGETFEVEIIGLRHYLEKDSDLLARLKKWDGILKGKESNEPKPAFLL